MLNSSLKQIISISMAYLLAFSQLAHAQSASPSSLREYSKTLSAKSFSQLSDQPSGYAKRPTHTKKPEMGRISYGIAEIYPDNFWDSSSPQTKRTFSLLLKPRNESEGPRVLTWDSEENNSYLGDFYEKKSTDLKLANSKIAALSANQQGEFVGLLNDTLGRLTKSIAEAGKAIKTEEAAAYEVEQSIRERKLTPEKATAERLKFRIEQIRRSSIIAEIQKVRARAGKAPFQVQAYRPSSAVGQSPTAATASEPAAIDFAAIVESAYQAEAVDDGTISISRDFIHRESVLNLVDGIKNSLENYAAEIAKLPNGQGKIGPLYESIRKIVKDKVAVESRAERKEFLSRLMRVLSNDLVFSNLMKIERTSGPDLTLIRDIHNSLVRHQFEMQTKKQIIKDVNARFLGESGLFAIAIGAVMVEQLVFDYSSNPASLQHHLESLKDPFAHLAFYSFMVASGISTKHLSILASQAGTHKVRQKMFHLIPYLGMTVGSLASQLVGDIGVSLRECSTRLLATEKAPATSEEIKSCDMALKQWSLGGKSKKYIPTFISMLASNAMSAQLEKNIVGASRKGINAINRAANVKTLPVSAQHALENSWGPAGMFRSEMASPSKLGGAIGQSTVEKGTMFIKDLSEMSQNAIRFAGYNTTEGAKYAWKVIGTRAAITWTAGGPVVTGINMIVKVVRFMGFTYFDHKIAPFINLGWVSGVTEKTYGNLVDQRIETMMRLTENGNFLSTKPDNECLSKSAGRSGIQQFDSRCRGTLVDALHEWHDFHREWRTDQNSDFENAFSAWGESLKNVNSQYSLSFMYYVSYIQSLFKSYRLLHHLKSHPEDADKALASEPFSTTRPYPLFGILMDPVQLVGNYTPDTFAEGQIPTDPLDLAENVRLGLSTLTNGDEESEPINLDDYKIGIAKTYLTGPVELEKSQFEYVKIVTKILEARRIPEGGSLLDRSYEAEKKTVIEIRDGLLNATTPMEMGKVLVKLNAAVFDGPNQLKNPNLLRFLREFRWKYLGNPRPILLADMGYPFIFAQSPQNSEVNQAYPIPYHQVPSMYPISAFERTADYLNIQMACGPNVGIVTINPGFTPDFHPPRLININERNDSLCMSNALVDPKKVNQFYVTSYSNNRGKSSLGIMSYIRENIDANALGDYSDMSLQDDFAKNWWRPVTESAMTNFFTAMDKEWNEAYYNLAASISRPGSYSLIAAGLAFNASYLNALKTGQGHAQVLTSDRSYGDALRSFLRSWVGSKKLSINIVEALRTEKSLYDRVLVRLAGEDKNLTESVAQFFSAIESGILSISGLKIDKQGAIIGRPSRQTIRETKAAIELARLEMSDKFSKALTNPFQKEIFETAFSNYGDVIAEIQKIQLASTITKFDPNESAEDRIADQKLMKQIGQRLQNLNQPTNSLNGARGGK